LRDPPAPMLLERIFGRDPRMRSLVTDRYEICWRGLAYCDGLAAGRASMEKLFAVSEEDLPRAAAAMRGVFFIAVRSRNS
jgi:hypothetical protein